MNTLFVYLLTRFWPQLLFALAVDAACQIWFGGGTWQVAGWFIAGFAFVEALFLLDRRRRTRLGLPHASRVVFIGSVLFLCIVPVAALGLGYASGRHLPADSSTPTGPPTKPKPPQPHRTVKAQADAAARDANVVFTLFGVARAANVPTSAGARLTPVAGDALVVVDMLVATDSDPAAPFCTRGYGALLVDLAGRRFKTVRGENTVPGMSDQYIHGSHVCDTLAPGAATYQKLVFQIPAADRVDGIALWDKDEVSNRQGRTYLYFRLVKHGAIPGLGVTARGPSRDG